MMLARPLSRLFARPPIGATPSILRAQPSRFLATETVSSSAAPMELPAMVASSFTPPPAREERGFAMKRYKPRTPGVRHLVRTINEHLWKGGPFKALTIAKKGHGKGGRNHTGRITVRHHGEATSGGSAPSTSSESSRARTESTALSGTRGAAATSRSSLNEATQKKSYILAADGLRAGDVVQSYRSGIPNDLLASMGGVVDPGMLAAKTAWRGNCLPLHMIPIGTLIHAVGSGSKGHAVFCRSAGTYATVIARDEKTDCVDAAATVGVVSNPTWQHRQLGKAGRSRWLNIRPTVRGLAMNASDHPHGGGRGKSKGNRHPVSPWGIPTKSGYKTRSVGKPNKWVVVPRVRNQGKRRAKS
ncbi:translation protein SH3-like domain-containing protein [Tricharina praecox]|uniref:translation protein SH3-like domain-containing protein n=1 Tax=Tricharina praecox TaxID=43433 RepID=UPI00222033EF|nr:translation protein SH3-like domain-containing protein [Tricharina praecox]KAI5840367.1 translation protein SH3-like domain-containing protein [Tricharina praecox]